MTATATVARARLAVAAGYAAAIATIQIGAGQPGEPWWWLPAVAFFLWTIAPIAVPLLFWRYGWPATILVSAIAAWSLYIYWTAMFGSDPSSTSALVFIFLPLYQWGAVMLVTIVAEFIGRRRRL